MKRIAIAALAGMMLSCMAADLQAHGRGGWGFSFHVAPPAPPPCYHYCPPPYPGPYVRHYYPHYPPPVYYAPPRFGFWYGF
jgi:hypothetical protein